MIGAKIIAMVVLVLSLLGGVYYVSELKADLAVSQQNEQKLTEAVSAQKSLMESMKKDFSEIQQNNKELQEQAQKHAEEVKELTDKFNVNAKGEARDFGAIASAKPRLIERLINRGTDNAMRCIEIVTGSPLTEKELNAKTSSEINRECPSIANPNYIPVTP